MERPQFDKTKMRFSFTYIAAGLALLFLLQGIIGSAPAPTVPYSRFQTMLERVRQRLSQQGAVPAAERAQVALGLPLRRLFARTRDGIVPIDVRSIQHLQASGDYVEVFCESGRYLLHTSLAELAQRLDPEVFCQVHRSHMVNLEAVELLRPYDARRLLVELRGGRKIVASRAASEQLRRLVR